MPVELSEFKVDLAKKVNAVLDAGIPWDVQRAVCELEHLILSDLLLPMEEESVIETLHTSGTLAQLQSVFCKYETELERSVAKLLTLDDFKPEFRPARIAQP